MSNVDNPTVLIIEDDFSLGVLFTTFLELDQITSNVCRFGKDAIQRLDDGEIKPKMVILDMHLPDMEGADIFEHLREHHPNIAIMIVTADVALYGKFRKLHRDTYNKPMDMVDFRAAALKALPA